MTKSEKKRRKKLRGALAREKMKKWPYIAAYPKQGKDNA